MVFVVWPWSALGPWRVLCFSTGAYFRLKTWVTSFSPWWSAVFSSGKRVIASKIFATSSISRRRLIKIIPGLQGSSGRALGEKVNYLRCGEGLEDARRKWIS